jgi:LPS-assembly lipoprotein
MRVAGLLLLLALAGCGFHLEGSTPLPLSLGVVHVDTSDTQTDFYFGLRKALMAAGTRIDDDGHDAEDAIIHILNDSSQQKTLNVPTEYELRYKIRFSVTIKGREVISPEDYELVRDYAYSETAQLAKARENAILSQALAHDLVSVVMRRLASLSGAAAHS